MIRFKKVTQESYEQALINLNEEQFVLDYRKSCYDNIKLPKRATKGSAGYDFFAPYKLVVKANTWYTIPLGIKYETDRNDIVLLCLPRSGLGFKYNMALSNTLAAIDSDYQYAKNDGHIMLKFKTNQDITIEEGQAILQGIFTTYIKVDDDNVEEKRIGGFGSTSNK